MNKVIKYDNGLRVVIENIPTLRSVVTGIWVGAGSSRETPETNGISHFTEHMMFKGTDKLSPFDIANAFESVGAMVNAFTGKENTCYYVKSVDEYAERCFEIMCDILHNSNFDKDELDKERKVIVEEINMVEDSPEDICYDLLASAIYKNTPLGQTILGSIENVNNFGADDIRKYMAKTYVSSNIVIAFAGNITDVEADRLVRKYFLPYVIVADKCEFDCEKVAVTDGYNKRVKDFEQTNIAISYPSIKFNDKLFATQAILNLILGGGMSSRLFQNIREQLGLAYSVYSAPSGFVNNGSFNIVLNITPKNTEKAIQAVKFEIDNLLKNGISQEEFTRAKAQLKSASVFAQENVQTIMSSAGKLMLMSDEIYDVDKRIADIDNVTVEGVNSFANDLFTNSPICVAYVGKENSADILKILK